LSSSPFGGERSEWVRHLATRRDDEASVSVTKEELLTLFDGDSNDMKAKRDMFAGLFVTALFALFGLLASNWDILSEQHRKWPFWFIIPFLVAVVGFGTAWFIYGRFAADKTRTSHYLRVKVTLERGISAAEQALAAAKKNPT
jgi:hypothetical protein